MLSGILLLIACSLAVGMTPWPRGWQRIAQLHVIFMLLISLGFSLLLRETGLSWFALGQQLRFWADTWVLGIVLIPIYQFSDWLSVYSQKYFWSLPLHQGVCLLLLFLYSIWRTSLLLLLSWHYEIPPYPLKRIVSLWPGVLILGLPQGSLFMGHGLVWTGLWLLWLERDVLWSRPHNDAPFR